MDNVPFPQAAQLCDKLSIAEHPRRLIRVAGTVGSIAATGTPSSATEWLPGQPWLRKEDQPATITQFLKEEFMTDDLDKLSPHMWLLAKQDSRHISSLTHQRVRGRQIVVTEDPGLHLTWIYERVFIKPLPEYLLSHAFWEYYLTGTDSPMSSPDRKAILRAAKGFLRSWAFLIQHKADYLLAIHDDSLGLVPRSIPFPELVGFLRCFKAIPDSEVSPRYLFGDLRLSRINFWVKIFLGRSFYFKSHGQYGAYFAQYYGPVLFVFAGLSIALGAMQVVLAVEADNGFKDAWRSFASVSRGFSVATLVLVLLVTLLLMSDFLFLAFREIIFAVGHRFRKGESRSIDVGQEDETV